MNKKTKISEVGLVDIRDGFDLLELKDAVIIVHSSLKSFGYVVGGSLTVVKALAGSVGKDGCILMPAFTYNTSDPKHWSRPGVSVPFTMDLSVDKEIGIIPETFRKYQGVIRSTHPGLSFIAWGNHNKEILQDQTLGDPLDPLQKLHDLDGDVLMIGTTLESATAFHLAEIRMKTPYLLDDKCQVVKNGKVEWVQTRNNPGCSDAFIKLESYLDPGKVQSVTIGTSKVRKVKIRYLVDLMEYFLRKDPKMFICEKAKCRDCDVRRRTLSQS